MLALDMADRMRANLGAADGTPGAGYDERGAGQQCLSRVYAASVVGVPAACTPEQLAADDMLDWQDQIQQSLPAATGAVCLDSTPNDGTAAATGLRRRGQCLRRQGVVGPACHARAWLRQPMRLRRDGAAMNMRGRPATAASRWSSC